MFSGPYPADVKAQTRTEYSVNFLSPSKRTQLTRNRSLVLTVEFDRPISWYSTLKPLMMPFANCARTELQWRRMVVEVGEVYVMYKGGRSGTGEKKIILVSQTG